MAVLQHSSSQRMATLAARTTIGRSSVCTLRIQARRASGEHARLAWSDDGWTLRDLGSRNGTWLGDRRLVAGEEARVKAGDTMAFGDAGDRWALVDDRAPQPFARADDQRTVEADGGMLALPSADDPQVMVFRGGAGWVAEDEHGAKLIGDQTLLVVDDTPWRLFLPVVIERTLVDDGTTAGTVAGLQLVLRVSRDQEFVKVVVRHGATETELAPRSYHYMLVVLAEAWAGDETGGSADRGWVTTETVAKALLVEPRTVNVYVCRLRQQFGRLGLDDAARIVERRPGIGQLRLGIEHVDLGPL